MSDRLDQMRCFVAAAEARGFSAAAKRLGSSQSSVSKQVARLEAALGVRLLHRTTRAVGLTDEGAAYLDAARRAIAAVADADAAIGLSDLEAGRIRLSAPQTLMTDKLAPMLSRFLERHPRIEIDAVVTDRAVELASEGIDLAIRVGKLGDAAIEAEPVGIARRMLVAAPAYLTRRGTPASVADLARHACLPYALLGDGPVWVFADGERVAVGGPFRADSPAALRAAALAGMGIALSARWMFEGDIAAGRLVALLPDQPPLDMPIHLITAARRFVARRVRLLAEVLRAEFAADPLLALA